MRAEYHDGVSFVVNTDDVCTATAVADLSLTIGAETYPDMESLIYTRDPW